MEEQSCTEWFLLCLNTFEMKKKKKNVCIQEENYLFCATPSKLII